MLVSVAKVGKQHGSGFQDGEASSRRQKVNRTSYFLRRGLVKPRIREPFQPKTGSRRRSTSSMP